MTSPESGFWIRRAQKLLNDSRVSDAEVRKELLRDVFQEAFATARLVVLDFTEAQNEAYDVGWQSAARQLRHLSWADGELLKNALSPHPFTPEQLRNLPAGQWVWVDLLEKDDAPLPGSTYVQAQPGAAGEEYFCCGYPGTCFKLDYNEYAHQWLVYPHKPFPKEENTTNA